MLSPEGAPERICAKCLHEPHVGDYAFHWESFKGTRKTTNPDGTTGFVRILHSTNPAFMPNMMCKIHLCASMPCLALHPIGKHGKWGAPIHMQRVPELPAVPPAVAEPTCKPPPGGFALPTEMDTTEATPIAEPAAMAQPETANELPGEVQTAVDSVVDTVVDLVVDPVVEVLKDQVQAPDCPQIAPLHYMHPPAPAAPVSHDLQQGGESATAVAVTAVLPPALAAQHRIESKLLALAREIRRPKAYVGYSAFILMGLLKKQRPCVWEGTSFIDLLQVFAPWALEFCTSELPMTAIACSFVAQSGGAVELVGICEQHPLSNTTHYVAGIHIPQCEITEQTCSFEALYASLGVACVASVVDGDCGLDVMTMMLGIAPSFAARKELRIEISDYLITRIGEPWMHDIMAACQELSHKDVVLYRSGDTKIVAAAMAPPPAVAEPAAPTCDETGETTVDEETFAAMRWASKLSDDSCVLSVIRTLPKEIVQEQVVLYRQRKETEEKANRTAVAAREKK